MSLVSQLQLGFVRVGTEFKALRTDYNGKIGDLTTLTTTAKSSAVAAINEIKAGLGSAGAAINDAAPAATTTTYSASKIESTATTKAAAAAAALISDASTTTATGTTYSANKINTAISAAIAALINGAPTAFDTLKEISDQLATDESAASALTTAVGNRLRFDAAQTLTSPQQTQGQANLGVYSVTQIGDPTTDFAAGFVAALA